MVQEQAPVWLDATPFDDTIDGYFPLHVSLEQMLDRNGFAAALVSLEFAPIMDIPDLAQTAPVPLNIRAGYAGLIDRMWLCVAPDRLSGCGEWRWLGPDLARQGDLSPTTRLAEPCYLSGLGLTAGKATSLLFGAVHAGQNGHLAVVKHPDQKLSVKAKVLGPFRPSTIKRLDRKNTGQAPTATQQSTTSDYFIVIRQANSRSDRNPPPVSNAVPRRFL